MEMTQKNLADAMHFADLEAAWNAAKNSEQAFAHDKPGATWGKSYTREDRLAAMERFANGAEVPIFDMTQWNMFAEGFADWKPATGKEVREYLIGKNLAPEAVHVCKPGTEAIMTAAAAGFTNIPF